MPRFETTNRACGDTLDLELSPQVRLDLWALLFAVGIIVRTIALPLAVALTLASLVVSAGAAIQRDLVPEGWWAMALLTPLFVAGGVGVALLHATVFDPISEFATLEPGEVVVVGSVTSPPIPTKVGYWADVRVEHLWYKEKEILRGGSIQVYAGDMRFGVGDSVRVDGKLTRSEVKEDGFDYDRYLRTQGRTHATRLAFPAFRPEEKPLMSMLSSEPVTRPAPPADPLCVSPGRKTPYLASDLPYL